ncbi:hypothetical protein LINGRAHAP2_LOCUS14986 [Linum grandiflorum]
MNFDSGRFIRRRGNVRSGPHLALECTEKSQRPLAIASMWRLNQNGVYSEICNGKIPSDGWKRKSDQKACPSSCSYVL